MEIQYNRIESINSAGIKYHDNLGKVQTIDFSVCKQNWVDHVNMSDDFKITNLKYDDSNCIGSRNILGKPKYFILYTAEPTKIVFDHRLSFLDKLLHRDSPRNLREFYNFQTKIAELNLSTFDLT